MFKINNCCPDNIENQDYQSFQIDVCQNERKDIDSQNIILNENTENQKKEDLLNKSSLRYIRDKNESKEIETNNLQNNKNPILFTKSKFNKMMSNDNISISSFSLNKISLKINEISNDLILKEINKARSDILNLSNLIEKYSNYILIDENNKNFLLSNGNKIYFEFERKFFLECAQFLRTNNLGNNSLNNLEINDELKIPIPFNINNNNLIHKSIKNLKEKFKEKYLIKSFLSFRTTVNLEVSIIIQIVKDFSRNNAVEKLLGEDTNFVSINYKKIKEDMIAVYIILAK